MLVRVNAAELKTVFRDVKPILKSIKQGATLGFTVENHILYITCVNGIVYEQQLASEATGPYYLTVLYQDLSELLPGTGVVDLDLAPCYVEVRSAAMSATLPVANSVISRYKRRCDSPSPIDPATVKQWARLYAETAPVAKALGREAPIIFKPPYAVLKFPTFWLQLANTCLETTMGLSELKAVAEFAPTSVGSSSEVLEFYRGSAVLALPRNATDSCKSIDDMVGDHTAAKVVRGASYLPKVQQFLRSVGAGECRCHFYTDGISLAVHRPTVQSSLRVGTCTDSILEIPTFLEYVQMLFKLFADAPITVTEGKTSVRLKSPEVDALLSIL